MKKFSMLAVLVLSVLILSGCSKKAAPITPNNNSTKNTPAPITKNNEPVVAPVNTETEENITSSMEEMMKQGKSMKCTYSTKEDDTQINAVAYFDIAQGRYFVESEISAQETAKQVSYMMTDKTASYMWLKGSNSGTKFVLNEADKTNDNTEEVGLVPDDKLNFKCKTWSVENTIFKIPSEINFIDYTDNYNEVNEANNDIEANIQKYKELGESMPKN